MRTHLRPAALFAALVLAMPAPPAAAQPEPQGSWNTELNGDRVQLSLFGKEFGIWGRTFDLAALRGFSPAAAGAPSAPAAFRLERDAGVFAMEGAFGDGRGTGRYRFTPNREFAALLRSLPLRHEEPVSDRLLMSIAFHGNLSAAGARELASLGFERLTLGEVMEMAVHRVTPDYVRAMRALGRPEGSRPSELVKLRVHGVTPEYVRALHGLGYRGLTRRQLTEMRTHGVTPDFVRQVREAGFRDPSPEALVRMKRHGIRSEPVDRSRSR